MNTPITTQPSVAIVILNYNGKKYLEQFLPLVIASSYANKKIFVADNASTDDSLNFLSQIPNITVIALPGNFGFAGGYNKALQQIEADYYILLNSDIEVPPNWIEPVITWMHSHEKIAACQPKILSYTNKQYFEYAGAAGGWIDAFGYPFARGRIFDTVEQDKLQYNENSFVFWASGAALFIKASLFHRVGRLDEYFFAHMEEIDLCWRLQRSGYLIGYCAQSQVYHIGGGTLPKGHYRKTFLNFRNNYLMLLKNMPFMEVVWKLPFRFALDDLFALKSLLSADFSSFKAVQLAQITVIVQQLKQCFSKKKSTVSLPKIKMKQMTGVYPRSIVWNYFIKKKKYFGEII